MNPISRDNFLFEERQQISRLSKNDAEYKKAAKDFLDRSIDHKYSYQFDWLGRPIIQYPQDIVAVQELVFNIKPDLIIETGIAHGGTTVLYASLLCLLDNLSGVDPRKSNSKVISIDIDIREHNKQILQNHPLAFKYQLIEGSSISKKVIEQVHNEAKEYTKIMVMLDSNHTHSHVLKELEAYSDMVSVGSYCVVFDTIIENLPKNTYPNRPWDVGDNPMTAIQFWLKENKNFVVDKEITDNLLISVAPNGYLKRLK